MSAGPIPKPHYIEQDQLQVPTCLQASTVQAFCLAKVFCLAQASLPTNQNDAMDCVFGIHLRSKTGSHSTMVSSPLVRYRRPLISPTATVQSVQCTVYRVCTTACTDCIDCTDCTESVVQPVQSEA